MCANKLAAAYADPSQANRPSWAATNWAMPAVGPVQMRCLPGLPNAPVSPVIKNRLLLDMEKLMEKTATEVARQLKAEGRVPNTVEDTPDYPFYLDALVESSPNGAEARRLYPSMIRAANAIITSWWQEDPDMLAGEDVIPLIKLPKSYVDLYDEV